MSIDTGAAHPDWTHGTPALTYQACESCQHRWLFARSFCPACGAGPVACRPATGTGVVCATTLVTRAPSEALRAHAPYRLVLVDLEEGVRLMAHGAPDLAIGDAVTARFVTFGAGLVPYFERKE